MPNTHKAQHTIPHCYLKAWIEPVTPPGQHSAIYLISREHRTTRRKAPKNTFTETDRYTLRLKDGTRDLTIEHHLDAIENDFQAVLRTIRRKEPLTARHRTRLCAFTAAMIGRSKKQGDWMLKQSLERLSKVRKMEQIHNAEPITSKMMAEGLINHHGELVANTIEIVAPLLFQMTTTILITDDPLAFITSDAPAVVYNPIAHTFPPLYRSPGLLQKDVEVTLPLTPHHLVLFNHNKRLHRQYVPLPSSTVDEINRTTLFHCEKEVVSRTGECRDFWFVKRPEPANAWKPDARSRPILISLNDEFDLLYSASGRPSIMPEYTHGKDSHWIVTLAV